MNLIHLTKSIINKYKNGSRYMTKDEINSCMEKNKLIKRHRILFDKLCNGNGDKHDVTELMHITQRLYELGSPFYY